MNESSWISIKDRLPDVDQKCLVFAKGIQYVAKRVAYEGFYFRSCTNGDPIEPTHWQPLPEPPPKPDAFEEWWLGKHEMGGTDMHRFVGYSDGASFQQPIHRFVAKAIWDAAIASTKQSVV